MAPRNVSGRTTSANRYDTFCGATRVPSTNPSAAAYLRVAQYAYKAGRTAVADRAAQKAIDLAPKSQKKLVKQQVTAIKAQAAAAAAPGAAPTGSG